MDDSDPLADPVGDVDGGAEAESSPEYDGAPPSALELLADAEKPLRASLQGATQALGLPEPVVVVDDLLGTPADERFARSAHRYAERFGDPSLLSDPATLSTALEALPVSDPVGRGVRVVVRLTGQLEGELLAAATDAPEDPEPYLTVAVASRRLREVAFDVGTVYEAGEGADGDLQHLLSAGLGLTARLLAIARDVEGTDSDGAEWLPTLARDVVRSGYNREAAMGVPPSTVPAAKSDAELRRIVRLRGAVAAAESLDMEAEEAAALVDESPQVVAAALDRLD